VRIVRLVGFIVVPLCASFSANRDAREASATKQPLATTFPGDTWQRVPDPTRVGWNKAGLFQRVWPKWPGAQRSVAQLALRTIAYQ